jgi:hypothetical protein
MLTSTSTGTDSNPTVAPEITLAIIANLFYDKKPLAATFKLG